MPQEAISMILIGAFGAVLGAAVVNASFLLAQLKRIDESLQSRGLDREKTLMMQGLKAGCIYQTALEEIAELGHKVGSSADAANMAIDIAKEALEKARKAQ